MNDLIYYLRMVLYGIALKNAVLALLLAGLILGGWIDSRAASVVVGFVLVGLAAQRIAGWVRT